MDQAVFTQNNEINFPRIECTRLADTYRYDTYHILINGQISMRKRMCICQMKKGPCILQAENTSDTDWTESWHGWSYLMAIPTIWKNLMKKYEKNWKK